MPYPESDQDRAVIQEVEAVENTLINISNKGDMNSLDISDRITFDITHEVRMVGSLYAPYAHGGFCDVGIYILWLVMTFD